MALVGRHGNLTAWQGEPETLERNRHHAPDQLFRDDVDEPPTGEDFIVYIINANAITRYEVTGDKKLDTIFDVVKP